jgi:hypothetical protein
MEDEEKGLQQLDPKADMLNASPSPLALSASTTGKSRTPEPRIASSGEETHTGEPPRVDIKTRKASIEEASIAETPRTSSAVEAHKTDSPGDSQHVYNETAPSRIMFVVFL